MILLVGLIVGKHCVLFTVGNQAGKIKVVIYNVPLT